MSKDFVVVSSLSLSYFRVFKELEIKDVTNRHVFMGANGVGKTSVLWALVLLIRAYNSRVTSSQYASNPSINIDGTELSLILNHTALARVDINKCVTQVGADYTKDQQTTISATICGSEFKCLIEENGSVKLFPATPIARDEKIRFAFVSSEAYFEDPRFEVRAMDIFTSVVQNIRGRYEALPGNLKSELDAHLGNLFGVRLVPKDQALLVEKDGRLVEIMFAGSALRKTFTTLVLLYSLIATAEQAKVLLIEELEAQLYPTLQRKLLCIVERVATTHRVQLFLTSNTDQVMQIFSPNEIFVLLYPQPSQHVSRRECLRSAIDEHLLDIEPAKPLIACEGSDDEFFIKTVAEFLGLDLSKIQFHASASLCSSADYQQTFKNVLQQQGNTASIRFLRDLDFRIGVTPGFQPDTSVFFWSLPCIESYLFVDYCEAHKNDAESPLSFLLESDLQTRFAESYANSFRSQNRTSGDTVHMFSRWTQAIQAAHAKPPSSDDIISVAMVMRGHNWVKDVMKSKTGVLVANLDKGIITRVPTLAAHMKELLTFEKPKKSK